MNENLTAGAIILSVVAFVGGGVWFLTGPVEDSLFEFNAWLEKTLS